MSHRPRRPFKGPYKALWRQDAVGPERASPLKGPYGVRQRARPVQVPPYLGQIGPFWGANRALLRGVRGDLSGFVPQNFGFGAFSAKKHVILRFLRIHPVQSVVNNPTQLSGRGFPHIFYMKYVLSQLYVFFGTPKWRPGRVIWNFANLCLFNGMLHVWQFDFLYIVCLTDEIISFEFVKWYFVV